MPVLTAVLVPMTVAGTSFFLLFWCYKRRHGKSAVLYSVSSLLGFKRRKKGPVECEATEIEKNPSPKIDEGKLIVKVLEHTKSDCNLVASGRPELVELPADIAELPSPSSESLPNSPHSSILHTPIAVYKTDKELE